MGGKTKRAMLNEPDCVRSANGSVGQRWLSGDGAAKRKVHLLGFCLDFGGGVGWSKLDLCWIDCVVLVARPFILSVRLHGARGGVQMVGRQRGRSTAKCAEIKPFVGVLWAGATTAVRWLIKRRFSNIQLPVKCRLNIVLAE